MKLFFILFFCLLFIATPCAKTITLAVENSWPPYADKQGNGISKQRIVAALSSSEYQVEFVPVPYARALRMMLAGSVDGCFNVTRQADTEANYRFGNQPLLQAQASHFYPADNTYVYASVEQIPDNIRIGLIIGYEYGETYEKHRHRFVEVRVSEQRQIIQLLQQKRIDMAIMFDEVANYALKEMKLAADAVKKGEINHVSDVYVAFNKENPELADFIKALDSGLLELNMTAK